MRWWHKLFISVMLSVAIITILMLGHSRGTWFSPPTHVDLDAMPQPGQKLLIVAPHCDDETLAAAGLIMSAVRQGVEVRVVIVTNGDGYRFATMEEFHSLFPTHADFIRMGKLRQQESLHALRLLGVGSDKVYFLGYPDRGTPALWNDHWDNSDPYRSMGADVTSSPYPITYNHKSVYSGTSLLSDLDSILRSYKPDLIVYPHPGDVHPDHWGVGIFTRLALALAEKTDPKFRPNAYAYLVHRGGYPRPLGLRPEKGLLPPKSLEEPRDHWFRVDLSQSQTMTKWEAVRYYHSQIPLMRKFMESFVRRNELFSRIDDLPLPQMASGRPSDVETWKDARGRSIQPVQDDTTSDVIARDAMSSAKFVGLYAAEQRSGRLAISARLKGNAANRLTYTIRVMGVGQHGVVHYVSVRGKARGVQNTAYTSGNCVYDVVPMSALGNPSLIFVRAEVKGPGIGTMCYTTWQMLSR